MLQFRLIQIEDTHSGPELSHQRALILPLMYFFLLNVKLLGDVGKICEMVIICNVKPNMHRTIEYITKLAYWSH